MDSEAYKGCVEAAATVTAATVARVNDPLTAEAISEIFRLNIQVAVEEYFSATEEEEDEGDEDEE